MTFRRQKLSLGIALAGISTIIAPGVLAQSAENSGSQELQEVVIYGVRASLTNAINTKRRADDIRDVITTADIGNFPDQNLAEAAQRLPGVAITRSAGAGQFITIRGLPPELNRIAWNGVTLPSSSDDRAVPLDMFSSDLFGSLSVVKSQSADKDDGSLGGSLNLETPSPLSLPDNTLSLTARTFYNDLAEKNDPEGALLASKQFADGRLGIVGGITFSDRSVRQDSIESGGWNPVGNFFPTGDEATDELLVWENAKAALFDETRERRTALLAGEADLGDGGHYRLDVMHTRHEIDSKAYLQLNRFKNGSAIENIVGDGDKVVSADFIDATVGINQQRFIEETEATLSSLRGDWNLSDRWEVDAQAAWLQLENDWPTLHKYKFFPDGFNIGYDLSDQYQPQFRYNNFSSFDEILNSPELFDEFSDVVVESRDSKDRTMQLELNSRYRIDSGWLTTLHTGVQWQNREKSSVQAKAKDKSNKQPLVDFLDGGTAIPGNDNFLDGRLPWMGPIMASFDLLEQNIRPYDVALPPNRLDSFVVEEDSLSAYVRADFEQGRLSGNVGVRVLANDLTSNGYEAVNGNLAPVTLTQDYVEFLPSGTLNYQVRDDLVMRLSAGKALVKPQFADVAPRRSVNEDDLNVSQGNPALDPFQALQADLSLEWYFSEGGLLAAAALYKDIDSFIFNQAEDRVIQNTSFYGIDPVLAGQTFSVSQPLNGTGAKVRGLELIWQQPFDFLPAPFDGFGVTTNYTWLDSDANFSANIVGADQAAGEGLASQSFGLPGLSDQVFNTTLYYEKEALTLRLAHNARSNFLLTPAGAEGQPRFVEDFSQLDAFLGYELTDSIALFAEAINLGDEPQRHYSDPGQKLELYSLNGRRFSLGLRVRF
jgi:TonB-dependent receptor